MRFLFLHAKSRFSLAIDFSSLLPFHPFGRPAFDSPERSQRRRCYAGIVDPPPIFVFEDPGLQQAARRVLKRLPELTGEQVTVRRVRELRDRRGAVHAGSFLRDRVIAFDCTRAEFPRVFAHEVFHFVWVRKGNAARLSYERLVRAEWLAGAKGELGWSAEWRKLALAEPDVQARSRRWREYCCESFCDTGAWIYSGVGRHPEFTLGLRFRARRRAWFAESVGGGPLPI